MVRSSALTLALCLATITAQAALVSRLGGQAYYDTATDLTWVADANLAQSSGYDADGQMNWGGAMGWIASLNAQNGGLGYLGQNDWRLPAIIDTGAPGCDYGLSGTDCFWNVDLASGEMARMYYDTLGNTGSPIACSHYPPYCLTNNGPFSNIQPSQYWSGTEYEPAYEPIQAWIFDFGTGFQGLDSQEPTFETYSWAVRTGDIAAVPLPGSLWLLATGLSVLGWRRRKVIA